MTESQPNRVVVVGGGLAGLCAAVVAARAGCQVVLIEAGSLGGRARSTSLATATVNIGPHALYCGGEAATGLADLGIEVSGSQPGNSQYVDLHGTAERLPVGPWSLLTTRAVSLVAKFELAKVFARLPRLDHRDFSGISAAEMIERSVSDTSARRLLTIATVLATYTADLDQMSADAAVLQLGRGIDSGVLYLDGGWQTIVDALAAEAKRSGVEVVERTRVDSVETSSPDGTVGRFAVSAGSNVWLGDRLILAVSPSAVDRLMATDVAAAAGPAVKAAALDVVCSLVPERDLLLDARQELYASVHGPPARLIEGAGALLGGVKYLRADDSSDHTMRRDQIRAHMLRLGVSEGQVIDERYQHELVVAYGTPLAGRGGMAGRPGVELAPGAFVAGDWVGPDGLLADASVASGCCAGRLASAKVTAGAAR